MFEVSVFFRGTLKDTDAKRLTQLEDWAVHNGGNVNLEVVRCDLDERVPADLLDLWKSLKDAPLPTVVVRTPLKATGQHIFWQGRLSDPFLEDLATSPARREVAQRLLRGDAVVWLLLRGSDKELAARTRASLDAALAKLAEEIELPPGVGRPGSELLAKIPLQMKFSVVEVSAESAEEQTLIKLLHGGLAKAPVASDSYIAPVFGRGRVLNVLSASKLESETVGDWTRYLCSACSCQVKQQNPGFDLLCDELGRPTLRREFLEGHGRIDHRHRTKLGFDSLGPNCARFKLHFDSAVPIFSGNTFRRPARDGRTGCGGVVDRDREIEAPQM